VWNPILCCLVAIFLAFFGITSKYEIEIVAI
jgi:hypothetical protein